MSQSTMEFIVYEQKGAYAVITISREKALNALNSAVLELSGLRRHTELYSRFDQ